MNRHNGLTTAYYLTLKRFIRQGGKSIADITKYNAVKTQSLIDEEQLTHALVARPPQQMRSSNEFQSQQQQSSNSVIQVLNLMNKPQVQSQDITNLNGQGSNQHMVVDNYAINRGNTSSNNQRNKTQQNANTGINPNLVNTTGVQKKITFGQVGSPNFDSESSMLGGVSSTDPQQVIQKRTKTQDGMRNRVAIPAPSGTTTSDRGSLEGGNFAKANQQMVYPQKIVPTTNFTPLIQYNQGGYTSAQQQQAAIIEDSSVVQSRYSTQNNQRIQQSNLIMKQQQATAQILPSKLTRSYLNNEQQQLPSVTPSNTGTAGLIQKRIPAPQFIQTNHSPSQFNNPHPQHQTNVSNGSGAKMSQLPGDFSYMYFTPRDMINFKGQSTGKYKFNSQQPNSRKGSQAEDQNYIVAQSPIVQQTSGSAVGSVAGIPGTSTMSRRPKMQQTFFKPAPKLIQQAANQNPGLLSKSVNITDLNPHNHHGGVSGITSPQHGNKEPPLNRNSITEMPKTQAGAKRQFILQAAQDIQGFNGQQPTSIVSPYDLQKQRMQQAGTAGNRFRHTSYNLNNPQQQTGASNQQSPINVINNQLNITIYSGQNGGNASPTNHGNTYRRQQSPDGGIKKPTTRQQNQARSRTRAPPYFATNTQMIQENSLQE